MRKEPEMKFLNVSGMDVTCQELHYDVASHEHEPVTLQGLEKVNLSVASWVQLFADSLTIVIAYPGGPSLHLSFRDDNEFQEVCSKLGDMT
jgi:hypothetical protein